MEVNTSDGFELCPAEICAVDDAFCPAGPEGNGTGRDRYDRHTEFQSALGVGPEGNARELLDMREAARGFNPPSGSAPRET